MKLLIDQDVYALTVRLLQAAGHDVLTVAAALGPCASDEDILRAAQHTQRVLITRDADFGALVFVRRIPAGVIYLRITPATLRDVHAQLLHVLATHGVDELSTAFTVVEARRYRMRKLPTGRAP